MKKDVLYFMELNNGDLLEHTEFSLYSNPGCNGSLIVNLITTKEIYKEKKEEVSTSYERLILIGKIKALQVLIDESDLYSKYFEKIFDVKDVIKKTFHNISDFKKQALKSLDHNDRNEALINLSASDEVDHILTLIEKFYIGG